MIDFKQASQRVRFSILNVDLVAVFLEIKITNGSTSFLHPLDSVGAE